MATVAKKFSFLKESKTYYVDDVVGHASASITQNKLKIYEKVEQSEELIRQNYKMMQLYSPLVSASLKQKVTEIIENYRPEFNKTGLRKEMIREGFGEVTLSDLFSNFNNTISNFSLFF